MRLTMVPKQILKFSNNLPTILLDLYPLRTINVPANIYLFKGSTRKKWEIMFKVNYKNTGTTLLKSFYRYYC